MMRPLFGIIAVGLALTGPTSVVAKQRIPLSAAMAQCDTQSMRYSKSIAGREGQAPTQYKINERYRACVYAKSGYYPDTKKAESGIHISGTARIGIVVKK